MAIAAGPKRPIPLYQKRKQHKKAQNPQITASLNPEKETVFCFIKNYKLFSLNKLHLIFLVFTTLDLTN
jgi:hypothetical protein